MLSPRSKGFPSSVLLSQLNEFNIFRFFFLTSNCLSYLEEKVSETGALDQKSFQAGFVGDLSLRVYFSSSLVIRDCESE